MLNKIWGLVPQQPSGAASSRGSAPGKQEAPVQPLPPSVECRSRAALFPSLRELGIAEAGTLLGLVQDTASLALQGGSWWPPPGAHLREEMWSYTVIPERAPNSSHLSNPHSEQSATASGTTRDAYIPFSFLWY